MTTPSTLSDEELVQRCRAGDPDAWGELVERYSRYVYAICVKGFRLSEEDAEDVFQDVFARVFTRLDTLRDAAALRPWIAQLTRRRCLDAISGGGKEQSTAEIATAEATDMEEIDEAFAVREAVATLSDACRDILDRFFAQDQSYRTISEELGLPSGTIASRIARCLRKLRDELEGRNEAPEGSRRER
ncbi:MAG TPA: sigma-70 family RNA polymerase sigma factor [Gaiellaceae bacterium]|nr:sigma-70 family RNA polymerase sigma factor [Gaiellaceae bacterium]